MDAAELLAAIAVGSLTTAFGWWLNERSAQSRYWSVEKKNAYAAYLAAANRMRRAPRDERRDAFLAFTETLAALNLVASNQVLAAANVVLTGVEALVAEKGDGALLEALTEFQVTARDDLGVRYK